MRFSLISLAVLVLFGLTGCTKFDLLDATVPRYGYQAILDVPYGREARHTLDIYLPEKAIDRPTPVVVFFYGGAWQRGRKEDYRFVGEAIASQGYIGVVANYRLYNEVSFPAFVEDSAEAVAWVHRHIAEAGGDPQNLFLAGHSAGAYNAMMLTLDPRYLRAVGGSATWIRGTIGLSGPYHFLPVEEKIITQIFSTAPEKETQPVLLLNGKRRSYPPVFLATGGNDIWVVPANTDKLAKALAAQGSIVETHVYPDLDHADVALALAHGFHRVGPVLHDAADFIERWRTH